MVHAVPAPQITWYKNGDELRLDGADKYLLSRDGRELVITAASIDDTARYTCVARNLAGEIEKNFDVVVHGLISSSFCMNYYKIVFHSKADCPGIRHADTTGTALPENNEASAGLTTVNGGTFTSCSARLSSQSRYSTLDQ